MLNPLSSMGTRVMSRPWNTICPLSASVIPRIRFSRVVFPHPDGPRMDTISPSPIVRLMSSNMVTPSNDFLICFNSSINALLQSAQTVLLNTHIKA